MPGLPPELVRFICKREGRWSAHAARFRDEHDLSWADVESVARTSDDWKRETDEKGKATDGCKDSATGHDTTGRKLFVAGKRIYYEQEEVWRVITIKQHREERQQRSKPRRRS